MIFHGARDFDLLETTGAVVACRKRRHRLPRVDIVEVIALAAGMVGVALLIIVAGSL